LQRGRTPSVGSVGKVPAADGANAAAAAGKVTGWPGSIRWKQFRVVDRSPDGDDFWAQTGATLEGSDQAQIGQEKGQLRLVRFEVKVSLNATETWVVRGKQSDALLAHEQRHWDIAGLVAHEWRRSLEALRAANRDELAAGIQAIVERFQSKVDRLQVQYDDETQHGRAAGPQKEWDDLVRGCIQRGYAALPEPPEE
jgi:hypothetical protein